MSDVVWRLEQSLAELTTGHLELKLNTARPQEGLQQLRCDGQSLSAERLLGIVLPGIDSDEPVSVDEAYIRGPDLIVRYARTAVEQFSPQVHWRYRTCEQAVGVEVIISMQTDLLDSRPMVQSLTALTAGELLCAASEDEGFLGVNEPCRKEWSTPILIFRPTDASFSLVEMAYPSDVCQFWTDQTGGADRSESGFRLLHQHLEKGVIRRLRVACWFVPRDADAQFAWNLFRQLVHAAPPLEA